MAVGGVRVRQVVLERYTVVVVVVIKQKRARPSHVQTNYCRRFLRDGGAAHDVDGQRL